MPRRKKVRSPEAFAAALAESILDLDNEQFVDHDSLAEHIAEKLKGSFDPTGVLRFTLNHPLLWWWRAKVVSVVDGDTMDVFLDRGFRDTHQERIRLHRVNAWETRGEERPKGLKASNWAKKILTTNRELLVHTTGPDDRGNFGRWLAQLWVPMTEAEDKAADKVFMKNHPDRSPDAIAAANRVFGDGDGLVNLGEWMLELGHARPYKAKRKKEAKK